MYIYTLHGWHTARELGKRQCRRQSWSTAVSTVKHRWKSHSTAEQARQPGTTAPSCAWILETEFKLWAFVTTQVYPQLNQKRGKAKRTINKNSSVCSLTAHSINFSKISGRKRLHTYFWQRNEERERQRQTEVFIALSGSSSTVQDIKVSPSLPPRNHQLSPFGWWMEHILNTWENHTFKNAPVIS